jgi:hypothetical protein
LKHDKETPSDQRRRDSVDDSEVRAFLRAISDGKPEDLNLLIWTLPDKRSRWFQNAEDAIQLVESLVGQDIYVGVGLSRGDRGPNRRCVSEEIAGIVGVAADIDLRSKAAKRTSFVCFPI